MPALKAGKRLWRGRISDEQMAIMLDGPGFDWDELVFDPTYKMSHRPYTPPPAAVEAMRNCWESNRGQIMAEWNAGAEKDVPRSTMPWAYWAVESPTPDPYRRAQLRDIARTLKRHRAMCAARLKHYKESPK